MPVIRVAAARLDLHELVEVQDRGALRRGLAVAREVGAVGEGGGRGTAPDAHRLVEGVVVDALAVALGDVAVVVVGGRLGAVIAAHFILRTTYFLAKRLSAAIHQLSIDDLQTLDNF